MSKESATRATIKYIQTTYRQVMVKISRKTEPEMLDFIEQKMANGESVQAYIKSLIAEDMKKQK